jgi:hypothetical protein
MTPNIYKHDDLTLTVYLGKVNKNVRLLGSPRQKPDSAAFSNSTKFGVDVLDQPAREYSTMPASRKCSLQVFFN